MDATAHETARMTDDGCPNDGRRRAHKRPPAARFWFVSHTSEWVRLTVRAGETVEITSGGPTDEGYSYSADRFTFDGAAVLHEWKTEARDCDGRMDHYGERVCPVANLAARDVFANCPYPHNAGVMAPAWEDAEAYQRDYTAEAAGY